MFSSFDYKEEGNERNTFFKADKHFQELIDSDFLSKFEFSKQEIVSIAFIILNNEENVLKVFMEPELADWVFIYLTEQRKIINQFFKILLSFDGCIGFKLSQITHHVLKTIWKKKDIWVKIPSAYCKFWYKQLKYQNVPSKIQSSVTIYLVRNYPFCFNGKIYLIQELYNNHRFKEKLDKILVKRFETSTYEPNYISALAYIATELEHLQGYH